MYFIMSWLPTINLLARFENNLNTKINIGKRFHHFIPNAQIMAYSKTTRDYSRVNYKPVGDRLEGHLRSRDATLFKIAVVLIVGVCLRANISSEKASAPLKDQKEEPILDLSQPDPYSMGIKLK